MVKEAEDRPGHDSYVVIRAERFKSGQDHWDNLSRYLTGLLLLMPRGRQLQDAGCRLPVCTSSTR